MSVKWESQPWRGKRAGLLKSLPSTALLRANNWRCAGGQMRVLHFIHKDIGIKSVVMLPLDDKTVLFLKSICCLLPFLKKEG
jgi:hypothetical protein